MLNKVFTIYVPCPQLTFAVSSPFCPQCKSPLCSLPFPVNGDFYNFFDKHPASKALPLLFHRKNTFHSFCSREFSHKSFDLKSIAKIYPLYSPSHLRFCHFQPSPLPHIMVIICWYYVSLLQHHHLPNCADSYL